jgi:hypothetical protein
MKEEKLTMLCGEEEISCVALSEELLVPEVLIGSPNWEQIKQKAEDILLLLPPEAKMVPWVIGSTDKDLMGNPRVSESHAKGLAFDMSPCYSQDCLVPPDRRIMGMAWNIVNLATVWAAKDAALFAVEGDHLHVMLDGEPFDVIYCVPTIAGWYPLADTLALLPAQEILNKLFKFKPFQWVPATAEEGAAFIEAFKA